jgi:hypothetical protein
MANYINGKDIGTLTAAPSYLDTFNPLVGPFRETYNGLRRTSTGTTAYDETADNILTHINNYNQNLDKILTRENAAVDFLPNTLVLRDANGDIKVKTLRAENITIINQDDDDDGGPPTLNIGRIDGGRLEILETI